MKQDNFGPSSTAATSKLASTNPLKTQTFPEPEKKHRASQLHG